MEEKLEKTSENLVMRDPKTGQLLPGSQLNPLGKPKGSKHLTTKLFEALQTMQKDGKSYSDLLVAKILNDAVAGKSDMVKLVINYIDGMPEQGIDLTTGGEKINSSSDNVMAMAKEISERLKKQKT